MLKTAKIIGLNSDQEAALALVCPVLPLTLFLILYCKTDDAFSKIKQALIEAEELFFASGKANSEKIVEVKDQIKSSLADVLNLQLLLAVAEEKEDGGRVFYLLIEGDGLIAKLQRRGQTSDLIKLAQGELVSGFLKSSDRLVMGTKGVEEVLGQDFKKLFELPIDNLEEEVGLFLPQDQVLPLAGVVLEEIEEVEEFLGDGFSGIHKVGLSNLSKAAGNFFPRSKKSLAVIAITVFLFLAGGYFFWQKGQEEKRRTDDFQTAFLNAQKEYDKVFVEKEGDQQKALESLESARNFLEEALKIKNDDKEALKLKQAITDIEPSVLKIYSVPEPALWLDLGLVKKGFTGAKWSFSLGEMLILDPALKVLLKINLQNKSPQILAGEEKLGEAKFAALNGEISWVYSLDKGVVRVEGDISKAVIKKDKEWGEIEDIYGFAGNAYLLDKINNEVWKYLPIEAGYSDKRGYFKEGSRLNLSNVLRMQIDGSVWFLRQNGEILKFTQGAADHFSLSDLDKGIKGPKSFFISDKTENLYILDSGNKRLVVVDKKGVYLSQYYGEKFGDFTDLLVDEGNKKVYFLEGSKIYWIELK